MNATHLFEARGLDRGAVKEALHRICKVLGVDPSAGVVTWGAGEGGAQLSFGGRQLVISFIDQGMTGDERSRLEVYYFGHMPDDDAQRIIDCLRSSPLPVDSR